MSQATTWSVPLSGPATPTTMATRMDDSLDALLSSHSGSARPAYAVAGTIWISTATAGKLKKYLFDGTNDRLLETIDIATGAITYEGGTMAGAVNYAGFALQNPVISGVAGLFIGGYLSGLTFSNDTGGDVTNDFITAAGSAASDDATPVLMTLASAMTKRTDAAWASGTGNGCWLDGASMPNGTGHVFLIRNPTSGAVDIGASASLTPTLPSGYTQKRRIHSAVLRSSASLVLVTQTGDEFIRSVPVLDVTTTTLSTTAVLSALSVPLGIQVGAIITGRAVQSSTSYDVLVTSPSQPDTAPTSLLYTVRAETGVSSNFGGIWMTNTSGQIRYRSDQSSTTLNIFTRGWMDTRGRI